MSSNSRSGIPILTLVRNESMLENRELENVFLPSAIARDVDWSILMARGQAGDAISYRRLLEEISPYLRSVAARCHRNKSDVEDAVQDVLVTVHAIRATYDPMRPFGPWLLAIANRRIVDRLRRQGRGRMRETPLAAEHETIPDERVNVSEAADYQMLEGALERLSPGQRQAIQLLKLKEMSLKEAAVASGMSIATLKVATHRALKSLRKILTDRSDK